MNQVEMTTEDHILEEIWHEYTVELLFTRNKIGSETTTLASSVEFGEFELQGLLSKTYVCLSVSKR